MQTWCMSVKLPDSIFSFSMMGLVLNGVFHEQVFNAFQDLAKLSKKSKANTTPLCNSISTQLLPSALLLADSLGKVQYLKC